MFSARELAKVKPNALIVNTSRGSVLDFTAVANAAVRGDIGGLAVDVYPAEPYRLESDWASCPTIYCTPHIGGNTREAVLAMGRAAIAGIREALTED
jgi:D-3-phosphoglycerate dehydrogenase